MPVRSPSGLKFKKAAAILAACLLLGSAAVAQDAPDEQYRYSLGGGVAWYSAGSPMDAGAGLVLRYSRNMHDRPKDKKPWPIDIRAGLGFVSLDREAEGETQQGELDAIHFSLSVARPLNTRYSLVAGVDFVSPDATGTYVTNDQPIAISNTYDADPAVGVHAGIEFARTLGKKGIFFVDLRYLVLSVDGEHRFVIDGIEGDPVSGDFDMGGPRLTVGFGRRF